MCHLSKYTTPIPPGNESGRIKRELLLPVTASEVGWMTAVSAPGKALIAGGYLVLERENPGLVISLPDARFYTVIQDGTDPNTIHIRSPQFPNAHWTYNAVIESGRVIFQQDVPQSERHPFIEHALSCVFNYLGNEHVSINITLLADDAYYSQGHRTSSKFTHFKDPISTVSKTGLGSSAALVTSLVGALLQHYGADVQENQLIVHNLAQVVHCAAQGKVGSGFDVAAAVFGSCEYSRFSPSLLDGFSVNNSEQYKCLMRTHWDVKITPFVLPSEMTIVMGDVKGGSATPGMVKVVSQWRQTNSEAADLWDKLNKVNTAYIKNLRRLAACSILHPNEYMEAAAIVGKSSADHILKLQHPAPSLALFKKVIEFGRWMREALRKMGDLAGVDIEPPSQTALLDECAILNGVLCVGIPGAGGNDAIYCLVVGQGRERLRQCFRTTLATRVREIADSHPSMTQRMPPGIVVEKADEILKCLDRRPL